MNDKHIGIVVLGLIAGGALWVMGGEAGDIVSHSIVAIGSLITGGVVKKGA